MSWERFAQIEKARTRLLKRRRGTKKGRPPSWGVGGVSGKVMVFRSIFALPGNG